MFSENNVTWFFRLLFKACDGEYECAHRMELVLKENMTELFVVNSSCKVNTKGISNVGKLK
jgi:hypothetical protein